MFKNVLRIIVFFVVGMVGGIFADQIFWPYFVERPLFYQYRLEQGPVYVTERKEIRVQENIALKNAIEKTEKAVVGVRTKLKNGKILEGSGLILSSDGLVVSLNELAPVGGETIIFLEDEQYKIGIKNEILKRDSKENLVLFRIEKKNLPTLGFADLAKLKIGERVFLLGVIFGERVSPQKAVNEGIVKSFDDNFIQTNIFENQILSGSPLFDIEGNLLGLNTVDKQGRISTIPVFKIRTFAGF